MSRRATMAWGALRLVALVLVAVACSASARETALRTSLAGLNGARDGFLDWDRSHQAGIVAHATSLTEGQGQLAAYRHKREAVVRGFMAAYSALALAAVDITPASLADAVAQIAALYSDLRAFEGGP